MQGCGEGKWLPGIGIETQAERKEAKKETQTEQKLSRNDGRIWDVVVKTCDLPNAGTDAAAYLKIFYEAGHDSETFQLDNPAKDPPTYAAKFHRLKYVDCVSPAAVNANRKHYMRYDDNIADGQ
ncbi:hypothetical protein WR25_18853 [Diploscapter pachys]|uniref:Uncharacterized protein n=1 Tax=Diploscapter pachys TaxID=2018661 RepID=A0A2A2KAK1_9BILA|nr:hypothetical protein WR25_18853 [Diploscapter pachys]